MLCEEWFASWLFAYHGLQIVLAIHSYYSKTKAEELSKLQKQLLMVSDGKHQSTLLFFQMCQTVPQLPELIMTNAGNKGWDFKNRSFSVGSRYFMLSALFSLVALANPTHRSTFPEEVIITYFHSPLVFSNLKAKYFLSLTNLQNRCIFEQFALESLYNGCLPMDHEKRLVTLSAKHKR